MRITVKYLGVHPDRQFYYKKCSPMSFGGNPTLYTTTLIRGVPAVGLQGYNFGPSASTPFPQYPALRGLSAVDSKLETAMSTQSPLPYLTKITESRAPPLSMNSTQIM